MGLKSRIYKVLRIWNDASAVRKGKAEKRLGRRALGRASGKFLNKLFK